MARPPKVETSGATPRRRFQGTGAALTSVLTRRRAPRLHPAGPFALPSGALPQVRDTVPQSSWSWSMSLLRSYGSVVGPLGVVPVGSLDGNSGCR